MSQPSAMTISITGQKGISIVIIFKSLNNHNIPSASINTANVGNPFFLVGHPQHQEAASFLIAILDYLSIILINFINNI